MLRQGQGGDGGGGDGDDARGSAAEGVRGGGDAVLLCVCQLNFDEKDFSARWNLLHDAVILVFY